MTLIKRFSFIFSLVLIISQTASIVTFASAEVDILAEDSSSNLSSSKENSTPAEVITLQTKQIQESQNTISGLQNQLEKTKSELAELESNVKILTTEEVKLQEKITQLQGNLDKLNQQIKSNDEQIKKLKQTPNSVDKEQEQSLLDIKTNLQLESSKVTSNLDATTLQLTRLQAQIAIKSADLKAKQTQDKNLENEISNKRQQIDQQLNTLQSSILMEIWNWAKYIIILASYWLIYRIVKLILKKRIQNRSLQKLVVTISTVIWLVLTLITILIAILSRLQLIQQLWTVIAFVSLSISLALKDFVSGIFSFILISMSKQYAVGDIVEINEKVGRVDRIGIFITNLREISRESYMNEQFTGKIISIPNQAVLTQTVFNYTKENKIIWHKLNITVDNHADLSKVRDLISQIMDKQFSWALDHKDEYLDNVFNLKEIYKPKIYLFLTPEGPTFNIRFAIRFGAYNKVLDKLSSEILSTFNQEGIVIKSSEILS